jgi:hypothetical protein
VFVCSKSSTTPSRFPNIRREPDIAVTGAAALVPDRKALRARVVERLKETDALPDQIRRAYQIAESKL